MPCSICGKGNNGADGRVAARLLARRGVRVTVVSPGAVDAIGEEGPPVDLVVDAAFGTGFAGTYDAPRVAPGIPVLAVDIPSGVEGDTGRATGSVLRATATVTFVARKPGLVQGDGAALAGEVRVVDIGLPIDGYDVAVVDDGDIGALVPPRGACRQQVGGRRAGGGRVAGHDRGRRPVGPCRLPVGRRHGPAGGARGRPGRTGGRGGGGHRPRGGAVGRRRPRGGRTVPRRGGRARTGPGRRGRPTRCDASSPRRPCRWWSTPTASTPSAGIDAPLASRSPVVLTPHDGEYARLTGGAPGPDRIAAARHLAAASGAVALLKGPTTAVADPAGRVLLAMAGTPSLATAGTGDVLSGVIGALLARGMPPLEAAALGAHLHGRAGALGHRSGLVAGDLPDLVARVLDAADRG